MRIFINKKTPHVYVLGFEEVKNFRHFEKWNSLLKDPVSAFFWYLKQ